MKEATEKGEVFEDLARHRPTVRLVHQLTSALTKQYRPFASFVMLKELDILLILVVSSFWYAAWYGFL